MKRLFLALVLLGNLNLNAQDNDKGVLSGNFMSNTQFYDRDSVIGATTEVYNKYKSSTDAWLYLNYNVKGYSFSLRYDMFNNSPLLNPQTVYNKQGVGFWQASKDVGNLNLTVGYFYDQFASGMIFRAYEERLLGLDYAIQGLRVKYTIGNVSLKGFAGQQKGNYPSDKFGVFPEAIKGFNAEYNGPLYKKLNITGGVSTVNRTLAQDNMNKVVDQINSQNLADRFIPKYNTYAFNGYARLSYKSLSLYNEYNYKTKEAIQNQDGSALINKAGNIIFSTIGYSRAGLGKNKKFSFGANLQYKRVENFVLRTSPYEQLNNGLVGYNPSITRQNTYRLLARYNAVTQFLGEESMQGEIIITPRRGTTITMNASNVNSLKSNGDTSGNALHLFSEYYLEVQHKVNKNLKVKVGLQSIFYDQSRFEQKVRDSTYHDVETITPFFEIVYKLTKKYSIRFESQYLETTADLGSFFNGVLELNSPHWSFSIGDMVNTVPYRSSFSKGVVSDKIIHYYSGFVGYTSGPTVVSLAYIKQVQGVNCTGGICRVEPAFSGVRLALSTSF
ncbi:MAG: hypothetical protein IT245_02535 [Bacteroidia bacterium]|nr:hypothetical protein [Bacteroidia bacterium]